MIDVELAGGAADGYRVAISDDRATPIIVHRGSTRSYYRPTDRTNDDGLEVWELAAVVPMGMHPSTWP
jgi:hypothetical protein